MQILPEISAIPIQKQDLCGRLQTQVTTYRNGCKQIGDIHRHGCAEFGLCLSGNGVFFVGERVIPFYKGFVTYMPPEIPHIAQSPADSPSDWVFLFADPACFGKIIPPQDGVVLCDAQATALLSFLIDTASSSDNEAYYQALLNSFFLRLNNCRPGKKQSGNLYLYHQIMPAINHISKEYANAIEVEELARLCNMSQSLFFRSFHNGTGMSPIAYLHEVRISAAEAMLRSSDLGISEIANRIGYLTPSSFYRQFIKKHKVSPREYRRKHRFETNVGFFSLPKINE